MSAFSPERFRPEFPGLARALFLNHASEAPLNRAVRKRIQEYLDTAEVDPDAAPISLDPLKARLSQLFGGTAAEYAAMPNTATAIGIVAQGLDWRPGENVVVPDAEYPANVYPWLTLQERGVEVRRVPLDSKLRVLPERVAAAVDRRTRILAVSAVGYLTGFRCDLTALGAIARDRGALFAVDAIQAAGAVPINVAADGIDLLAAGGYKWLLGPVGTGFLYVRRGLWPGLRPMLPGARSSVGGAADSEGRFELVDTAQRYESGNLPFALLHGWTAGMDLLLEARVDRIHAHLLSLTDRLIAGLSALGYQIASAVEQPAERSGIVAFSLGDTKANEAVQARLYRQGIIVGLRGGRLRVSPHLYNNASDIDRLLEALK